MRAFLLNERSYWFFGLAMAVAASALSIPQASAATARDLPYTIANYPVDARAENAVAAKEKAIADGQQAALRSLFKRLIPVTGYKQIERLRGVRAADIIEGLSVRSERNSSTRYIASLDFSFRADAVRQILQQAGITFIETQAPESILVPVWKVAEGAASRPQETAAWTNAWSGLDLEHTLSPIRLDGLKPVIHADTIAMVAGGKSGGIRIFANEYNTARIVVAIAEHDEASQRLVVTLAGQDAVGPIWLKRSYRIPDGDVAYTMELAAVIGLGVLEGRWKFREAGPGASSAAAADGSAVRLEAQFRSSAEWDDLRYALLDTPGLEDMQIDAVTNRTADLVVRFPGGGARLAQVLAARGLTMINVGGVWTLRSAY